MGSTVSQRTVGGPAAVGPMNGWRTGSFAPVGRVLAGVADPCPHRGRGSRSPRKPGPGLLADAARCAVVSFRQAPYGRGARPYRRRVSCSKRR
jgi:hypothetical protein